MARLAARRPEKSIEAPGPDGDAVRADVGRLMCEINVPQFCCGGLNFGYFYERSPIVAYDGDGAAGHTRCTTSRHPPCPAAACRIVWLRDGRSLYDALGPWFTLLRFDRSVAVAPLAEAAARAPRRAAGGAGCGRGRRRHAVSAQAAAGAAGPACGVAWRLLPDPLALVDRIRGAAGETGRTTPAGEVDARRREENGSNQKTGARP